MKSKPATRGGAAKTGPAKRTGAAKPKATITTRAAKTASVARKPVRKSSAKPPVKSKSFAKIIAKAKPAATRSKSSISKAKPAATRTKATSRTATPSAGPKRAAPRSNRAGISPARTPVRRAPYRRAPVKALDLPPPEPAPVIPVELLSDAPKHVKPRKPRGKKAEAPRPTGALDLVLAQLDDSKAEQIVTINLDDKTAIADTMVVASGRSNRHVGAIADQLVERLKAAGRRDLKVEGMPQCDWVLVDAGDVVVHIFRPEVRSFYNLEKLWSEHAPNERAIQ